MFQQFLELPLVDRAALQQDGVPCHYALIVRAYLNCRFLGTLRNLTGGMGGREVLYFNFHVL